MSEQDKFDQAGFDPTEWEMRPHPSSRVYVLNTQTRITDRGQQIVGLVHDREHIAVTHPDWPVITVRQVLQAWQMDPHGQVIGMCQGCVIRRVKR